MLEIGFVDENKLYSVWKMEKTWNVCEENAASVF